MASKCADRGLGARLATSGAPPLRGHKRSPSMSSRSLCLIALAAPLLGACTSTLYRANQANVPLLREAHEVKATLANNNLQAAYAPSDHVGIIANGYWDSYNKAPRVGRGWLMEAGAGAFGQAMFRNVQWEVY